MAQKQGIRRMWHGTGEWAYYEAPGCTPEAMRHVLRGTVRQATRREALRYEAEASDGDKRHVNSPARGNNPPAFAGVATTATAAGAPPEPDDWRDIEPVGEVWMVYEDGARVRECELGARCPECARLRVERGLEVG